VTGTTVACGFHRASTKPADNIRAATPGHPTRRRRQRMGSMRGRLSWRAWDPCGSHRQTCRYWNLRKGDVQENLIFAMPAIGSGYGVPGSPARHAKPCVARLHGVDTRVRQSGTNTAAQVKVAWRAQGPTSQPSVVGAHPVRDRGTSWMPLRQAVAHRVRSYTEAATGGTDPWSRRIAPTRKNPPSGPSPAASPAWPHKKACLRSLAPVRADKRWETCPPTR